MTTSPKTPPKGSKTKDDDDDDDHKIVLYIKKTNIGSGFLQNFTLKH